MGKVARSRGTARIVALTMLVEVIACSRTQTAGDSAAAVGAVTDSAARRYENRAAANVSRAAASNRLLTVAASQYAYGAERSAQVVADSVFGGPGGALPTMTIATATAAPGQPPSAGRIIARVTSSAAFPTLGIANGVNYIWVDSSSGSGAGPIRVLVIPQDMSQRMAWLNVSETPAHPTGPRPVLAKNGHGYGLCIDCSFRHCTARSKRKDFDDSDLTTLAIP